MMKKEKNFLFVSACIACFIFPLTAKAKGVEALSLGAGVSYTNFLGKNFPGMYLDLKFFPYEKWSTGINVSACGRKVDNSFGQVTTPKLDYSEVSWVNQYDILKRGRWAIGLNILNGLAVSRLANKDKQKNTGQATVIETALKLLPVIISISFNLAWIYPCACSPPNIPLNSI